MNYQNLTNEWRKYLNESPVKDSEISDEILAFLFSDEISKLLQDETLNEGLLARAKAIAKKYGIPVALATSILTGAVGGKQFADIQNARNADAAAEQEAEPDPGSYQYYRGEKPPGYADLSNRESIEKAWTDIESLARARAPVSGHAPTMIDGNVRSLSFAYIPASELSPDTILPMSLMTAADYASMLESRLQEGDKEVMYLKRMIFGDTGKWASGTGQEVWKIEGNTVLLPPEWTIAHKVYADAVEERLVAVADYVRDNPQHHEEIFQQLGVESDTQFYEWFNDQMFKIAR